MLQGTNAYAQVPKKHNFFHLVIMVWTFCSVILKRCPIQFCEGTYEDQTAVKAASEKEGKRDESY